MAISTYAELQTAVQNWLMGRTDIADFVPDFIALGSGHINAELRVRQMETTATLTPSGGAADLPDDFLELIYIAETVNPRRRLARITLGGSDDFYPSGASGLGSFYSITGSSLQTYPSASYPLELVYYAAPAALSDSSPSNWLLDARPELYLRASLMMAAEFVKDDEEAAKHKALVDMIIGQMRQQDMASRGRGGITLRGPTP